MEFDDKTLALAKHLKCDPALIENNYSDYYTVNGRTVKEGRTPEQYKQLAEDFRTLLTEEDQQLVTEAIVNPNQKIKIKIPKTKKQLMEIAMQYPNPKDLKRLEAEKPEEKEYLLTEFVYNRINSSLEAMREPAQKRVEQLERLNAGTWKPPIKEQPLDIYTRLSKEHLYVSNILYYLVKAKAGQYSNNDHMTSLRRAWLGQPVSDTRRDQQVDDGEYLVLTDSEADDWEEECLRQLFQDMTHGVEGFVRDYLDEYKFVDDKSGNRGENINSYDGTEEEVEFEGTTYYIYRNN